MRVMLEATRTLVIWLFCLCWHLYDPASPFGETWTDWSFLQLVGFFVLAVGQATYGQKILWPCMFYPEPETSAENFVSPSALRAGTFSPKDATPTYHEFA